MFFVGAGNERSEFRINRHVDEGEYAEEEEVWGSGTGPRSREFITRFEGKCCGLEPKWLRTSFVAILLFDKTMTKIILAF